MLHRKRHNGQVYVSVSEAAKLLDVHPSTVRRLADAGMLEYIKVRRYRYIELSQIEETSMPRYFSPTITVVCSIACGHGKGSPSCDRVFETTLPLDTPDTIGSGFDLAGFLAGWRKKDGKPICPSCEKQRAEG